MTEVSGDDKMPPPIATRRPHVTEHHGLTRNDDYSWLRASNWQDVMRDPTVLDGDIRAYLEAENAYTEFKMADTLGLQETLFGEMKGRIKEDDSTVPAPDGDYLYFVKYITGGQHPVFCRRQRDVEAEEILIDGNKLAENSSYFRIGGVVHSFDHKRIAYAVDDTGSEYYAIKIRDLITGELLDDEVPDTSGGAVWAADNKSIFYTKLDDNHRPRWVYRHTIGTPVEQDELIYEENDPGFFVGIGLTQSRRFVLISVHDHQTSEIYLIDSQTADEPPRLVAARREGHEYSVEHWGEKLIILTNADGAEDFKIVETPIGAIEQANWRDIEPHRKSRLILDMVPFASHLVRLERENGLPRIVLRRWTDGEEHTIAFDEEAYSLGVTPGYEFDTSTLRFSYSSMTTPVQTIDYDMENQERVVRKTQRVPSGHDPSDYVTRRLLAPASDGETIPISLLYKKNTPLDGSAPLLLYGYGAYGISIPAAFSTNCLSLVDRGFVYAIAHVRGGKDKGYDWYKQGRREKKINTFQDFVSCGQFLIEQNFTRRGHIVAHGGSAGGMLMGAIANSAPGLFSAIIAEVPFVDVLATMLDDTLPLTPPEWPEWGNPIENKDAYEWIAAYSPYDNVCEQAYPNILALAGLTDPRVTYWEPAKWIAKLRANKTDSNLVLLKTNMDAGHAGASGRFDRLKEVAISYAFALKVVNSAT